MTLETLGHISNWIIFILCHLNTPWENWAPKYSSWISLTKSILVSMQLRGLWERARSACSIFRRSTSVQEWVFSWLSVDKGIPWVKPIVKSIACLYEKTLLIKLPSINTWVWTLSHTFRYSNYFKTYFKIMATKYFELC